MSGYVVGRKKEKLFYICKLWRKEKGYFPLSRREKDFIFLFAWQRKKNERKVPCTVDQRYLEGQKNQSHVKK
jgi:hypothetical protein